MSGESSQAAFLTTSALLLSALCTLALAKTIYVDDDANGANNGTSWTDAYTFLQEALADAAQAEKPVEIRVAQGIYKPNQGLVAIPEFDWRTATFKLINGVTLKGGFTGLGASDPNVRDVEAYETILSGDLNGDDVEVADPVGLWEEPTRSENSYHVLTGSWIDESAVLDGFLIIGGQADGHLLDDGPFNQYRLRKGGGMHNHESSPTLNNCTFNGNSAEWGGGMGNYESSPTLNNCTFSGNWTNKTGGGMYNNYSSPTLTNCAFSGNWTIRNGGGMYNWESSPKLTNCTFAQNSADNGSALACGHVESRFPSNVELINCILRDGGNEIRNDDNSTIVMTYSNIQGGYPGEGNIDADPLFADPGYWANVNDPNMAVEPNDPNAIWIEGDYHLKSQTGRWDSISESWVKDDVNSPFIDAGDPNSDWGQEVWPHGGRINMGAYGRTPQASLSAEPQAMSLPRVAYIHHSKVDAAQGYQALLIAHGCPTTLVPWHEAATTAFDAFDLIIAGTDTGYLTTWADEQNVAAVESSGKPVVGLGNGGYWYFGQLGLAIGRPNGARGSGNEIEPVDPNHPLFNEPYPVGIPEDGRIEVSSETDSVIIFLYPVPVTVTALGQDAGNAGYYSLVLEHDRYLFSGFDVSAESLTEAGRALFVNVVMRTANAAWPTDANYTLQGSKFPRARP
ncbi:MAG: hypothetical protein JSW59_17015 [Phycisphaerales bacterium]|nr:MAG: hypothetical protein JSW59_17015 [Phycisphaerales bacterium]